MDFVDYRKRLGIGFNDNSLEELFFIKIFNLFDAMQNMNKQITEEEYFLFCMDTGTHFKTHTYDGDYWSSIMTILRNSNQSISEFLSYYIFFIKCQEDNHYKPYKKTDFLNILKKCLNESHIPFDVFEDNDGYFVFPKGAKELDDALISEPLEWLSDYPVSRKTFIDALRQYSEGVYIRDSADNLRKSLEDFLREFLNNDKDLNANKKEVEKYLKEQSANSELIKMLVSLISHYYLLNNDTAKHKDNIDKKYLEFLLYQTGLFIRMLIVVKTEEKDNAD